jgi:hypothetical protein
MKPTFLNYEQFLPGRDAVQEFSRRPVTAEVQNEILPCRLSGEQLYITQILLHYFGFSLSAYFHQRSIFIHRLSTPYDLSNRLHL